MESFDTHRAEVRPGVELAFWREGAGGAPLLLLHGWPETRRIWSRNVAALAAAGFEVVVPDLRGYGETSLAPDGFYDIAAHARDVHALMVGHLGHRRFSVSGSDLGGGVAIDLGLRFAGCVGQQVLFNCVLPILPETPPIGARTRQASDYFARQGREADALAAELRTPEERRRYVASFYTSRFWGTPGGFTPEEVAWMTEPFADAEKLRAGFGNYESAMGRIPLSDTPRLFEPVTVPTLALYGPDDHVIYEDFCERCEASFTELVGPFVVPRAGHFLQWERAELFNRAVAAFLRGSTTAPPTLASDG
ncbi:MAG: alpha/beta hydrolase [Solirubrobacterales bacterium]|nr:alpha/beta hydrolase [Solirubrobacterales bacterium]